MKIDRLVALLMVLLEHERISATKLAEMFEVTTRTIYRDIDTLELAGVPIITYTGVNGGIAIMEPYKVDKQFFTSNDVTTLLSGLGNLSQTLSRKDVVGTLAKVKSLIPTKNIQAIEFKANQIVIDTIPWAGNSNLQENLNKIKAALNENEVVEFMYSDRRGTFSQRQVEPYQLVLKENHWYLQGYCTLKKDYRIFKLIRMSDFKVLETHFAPRAFEAKPLTGDPWAQKKIIHIKLLIDVALKEKVLERCGEEQIKAYDDNKLLVDFPFIADDFGYNMLLGYGHRCECLEPEDIREELIRRIDALRGIYDKK